MRILIVEDEPTLGPQLKATLEGAGYAVDLATDGEDGHFLGSTENYDAAILDLGLPEIDGLTVDFTSTPNMAGRLRHWQYDSFITEFTDKALEPAYVTFALDADGKVTGVTMKPVNPIVDFSWDYQDLDLRPVGQGQ